MSLGMSPDQVERAVRRGVWVRRHPGVYVRAAAPRTPHGDLLAAVAYGGEGSGASHLSAAWLWGVVERPGPPWVRLGSGRQASSAGVHYVRCSSPTATTVIDRIPVTLLDRTLLDCAGRVALPELRAILDRAVAGHRNLCRALLSDLRPGGALGRCPGSARLRSALEGGGYDGAPEPSVLESHMARACARAGLSGVVREHEVVVDGERYRLDFALPALRLAFEVDGHAFHSSPSQVAADRRRRRALARAGWRVLVFTWREVVDHPDEVVAELRRATGPR